MSADVDRRMFVRVAAACGAGLAVAPTAALGGAWWHQIDVVAGDDKVHKGKLPKVSKRVGKRPPQYIDEEE